MASSKKRIVAQQKKLFFERGDGTRATLTDEQTQLIYAAMGMGPGHAPRPGVVPGFVLDGEALARRLNWTPDRLRLITHELAALGMDVSVDSDEPE